jgi:hypothetical protein
MALETGPYSFLLNTLVIQGPNGSFTIGGPDTAAADEGFEWAFAEDQNQQDGGADGSTMNSFLATTRGTLTVRLQKVSPVNQLLNQMWTADRANGGINWGQNTVTHRDVTRGDYVVGQQTAFKRHTPVRAAKVGGNNEWTFDVGVITPILGPGTPTVQA